MTEIVRGARAIGEVIGRSERAAFHLLEAGRLPAVKFAGRWQASRDRLIAAVLDTADTQSAVSELGGGR